MTEHDASSRAPDQAPAPGALGTSLDASAGTATSTGAGASQASTPQAGPPDSISPHGTAPDATSPRVGGGGSATPDAPAISRPRPATPSDVPEILAMVRELARYERSLHEVEATETDLHRLLFGANTPSGAPAAYCHVVDVEPDRAVTGVPSASTASAGGPTWPAPPRLAGFALWFLNASTWLGRHGIYLEDLYVRPQYRGQGHGLALMAALADICVERGYGRLEWWVLDWNTPAIGFYESLGAGAMDEWTVHRISGDALRALATGR